MSGQAKSASESRRRTVFNAMVLRPPFSGVENAVAAQARALVRTEGGFATTVLWPRALSEPPPEPAPGTPHAVACCGPRFASRALRLLWEQCLLPSRLRALGASLLHAPAYLAPLAAPCPVVLTVYDLHALDPSAGCRILNRWNYRLLLPPSIRRAARILVPSDHTARAVAQRFPAQSGRIRIVPLGVDARFHPGARRVELRPRDAPLPGRYLLCVGNVEPRKNLAVAVEALALLRQHGQPDLALVVAGHSTRGDPVLDETVRRHGLHAAVVRLGYVPDDQLPGLYAGAEALVYPSTEEGFGLPPLEAMACGCPVLCSDAGALRQTAGGAALHFPPDAPATLAAVAAPLLETPSVRAALVRRALAHAAEFQWPRLIQLVQAAYGEVLVDQDE